MKATQPTKRPRKEAVAAVPVHTNRTKLLVVCFTILCVAFTATAGWRYS